MHKNEKRVHCSVHDLEQHELLFENNHFGKQFAFVNNPATALLNIHLSWLFVFSFFKIYFHWFLERKEGGGDRNINDEEIINQLPPARSLLGIEPVTWACALTSNRIGDHLVHGSTVNHWATLAGLLVIFYLSSISHFALRYPALCPARYHGNGEATAEDLREEERWSCVFIPSCTFLLSPLT